MKVDSGGTSTPSPMASGDSGKRPRERMRTTSIARLATPAMPMDQRMIPTATGSAPPPNTAVTRSDTPFHCSAAGKLNCS